MVRVIHSCPTCGNTSLIRLDYGLSYVCPKCDIKMDESKTIKRYETTKEAYL